MGRIYNRPGTSVIIVEDNGGRIVWSTDRRPVNLLPEADWITTNRDIVFPDFNKFANYAHQRLFNPQDSSTVQPPWAGSSGDACQTVTMIDANQEWTGSDINLGTVPLLTNYLDVRVKITRTKSPSSFLDQTVPQLITNNQWVHLPGGSGLIEATTIWRRLFDIVLSGTSVVLRRRQSVAQMPTDAVSRYGGIYRTTGIATDPWGLTDYAVWGWVSSPGGDFMKTQRDGHPAALIEVKEFSANNGADTPTMGAKHPRRVRRCSIDMSAHDFSATYNADIVIRPGFMPP